MDSINDFAKNKKNLNFKLLQTFIQTYKRIKSADLISPYSNRQVSPFVSMHKTTPVFEFQFNSN